MRVRVRVRVGPRVSASEEMVQVYEEPLCRRHYAPFLSFTNFVRLLVLVGIIVSSFAICFASGGFWPTTRTIRTQPHVTFMHDMVVVLEGSRAGNELFWSTFPNLNAAMGSKYASMTASTTEEDRNFDGVADVIDVRLTARGIGAANVHSAKVLMQFSYIVDESRIDMNMKSLAYVSFASPLPGVGLYVDGTLRFDQVAALDEGKLRDVYNYNILPEGTQQTPLRSSTRERDRERQRCFPSTTVSFPAVPLSLMYTFAWCPHG